MYKKFYKTIGYLILIIGAISMLLPFVYMFSLSFMTDKQIFTNSFNLFPNPATLENYTYVINNISLCLNSKRAKA